MATFPRVAPEGAFSLEIKDIPPILVRTGATTVNSLWAESSQDAMLLAERDVVSLC